MGATGFIGKALVPRLLLEGHSVTAWVRNPKTASALPCQIEVINFSDVHEMSRKLSGYDGVINLAGEPISQSKWTPEFKRRFLESRTEVTKSLVSALKQVPDAVRPKLLLNASAIGLYGSRGDEILNEESSRGEGYLAEVCRQWEEDASGVESINIRTVILRIGIVLGRSGGMLSKLLPVQLGSGEQWVSWIHIDDVVRMILFSIKNGQVSGAVNVVAPNPVKQDKVNRLLAEKYHVPYSSALAVPSSALTLAAGELANVVLASQRCFPQAMINAGFVFQYNNIRDALNDLIDGCEEWVSWQVIPKPISEVFSFFSQAENLEALTPPWLNFKILSVEHPSGSLGAGSLIQYSLKIHGVPVRWKTLIEESVLNEKFVDTQLKGPYRYWHHTHEFHPLNGNTLMLDRVRYKLPLGTIGRWIAGSFVRSDIQKIFNFRFRKIEEIFGAENEPQQK